MSNFQIHELSTGALDRDSYIVHDSEVSGNFQTRKDTAGAVADLALEVVASEYDDTASYAIGSYCIYSGVLYRCTTATTGAFDVSDWTAVLITGEYKRVRVMHKADFDLLTPEEKADGMIFVDDVDITASDISYDNTVSGLTADDLQEAVDEVSGKVDDILVGYEILGSVNPTSTMTRAQLIQALYAFFSNLNDFEILSSIMIIRNDGWSWIPTTPTLFIHTQIDFDSTRHEVGNWALDFTDNRYLGIVTGSTFNYVDMSSSYDTVGRIHYVVKRK